LLLDFHPRRYFPSTNTATTKSLPSSCVVGTLANQADPHPHDRHDGEVWHC
jgi:hypothetical protein